ncbi:C-C chemokine receptor type 10 [Synchiropus splendidus]|uniref:C-C chemokine receptor type 10 n=1 Tax=Synchiropus splendidus TaxID=270530 RepID=UPI00237E73C6|nr:C-C chemokine receptor type 10 [Synchiropus splendidus]
MRNSSAMDADFYEDHVGVYYDEGDDYLNYSLWNESDSSDADVLASDWCEAGEQEFTIKMFQTCVFSLIFLLGVVGNALVIATFVLYRRLRLRSLTDVFLFHLSVADLLLLLTLPLQAVDTNLGWVFSAELCKVVRACYAMNTYSGLLLLACISMDRYMVVARAQEMLRLRRRILTGGKIAAVSVWIAATLLSLPEILFAGVTGSGPDAYCGMLKSGRVKMATNGTIIAVFCVSFLVMATCYSLIARVLLAGNKQTCGKQLHRQRTLKLMVVLVLVFLLFQLPYTIVLSQKMAGAFCALMLEYVTCTLAYARCCLNPILYALVGIRFRNDVLKLLRNLGCDLRIQTQSSTSISLSSPAPCSPASPDRSHSGNEPATANRFHF